MTKRQRVKTLRRAMQGRRRSIMIYHNMVWIQAYVELAEMRDVILKEQIRGMCE